MGSDSAPWRAARLVTEQVADEHATIRSGLIETAQALRGLLDARNELDNRAELLTACLSDLTARVRMHFHSEERSGLFQIAVETLSDGAATVAALHSEHTVLEENLVRAQAALRDSAAPDYVELREALRAFTELLARHEATEEELMAQLTRAGGEAKTD